MGRLTLVQRWQDDSLENLVHVERGLSLGNRDEHWRLDSRTARSKHQECGPRGVTGTGAFERRVRRYLSRDPQVGLPQGSLLGDFFTSPCSLMCDQVDGKLDGQTSGDVKPCD